MNPDLETFLEDVFAPVQPTSPAVGRVVVEPDYESNAAASGDAGSLREELVTLLRAQSPEAVRLHSHEGVEVAIPQSCKLLREFVRRITLHGEKAEGAWVEVEPPGNWI